MNNTINVQMSNDQIVSKIKQFAHSMQRYDIETVIVYKHVNDDDVITVVTSLHENAKWFKSMTVSLTALIKKVFNIN